MVNPIEEYSEYSKILSKKNKLNRISLESNNSLVHKILRLVNDIKMVKVLQTITESMTVREICKKQEFQRLQYTKRY